MKVNQIPRVVRFLPGWTIKIKMVTGKWLDDNHASANEKLEGLWEPDAATIYIRKGLTLKQKYKVYSHELIHAIHDWEYEIDGNTP